MSETRRLDETATELVRRAQAGDAVARDELLAHCQGTVYRWALVHAGDPDDADDIAQEVLVRLVTHLDRYAGRSRFTTWLYQVTRNTALELRRRMARRLRLGRALTRDADGKAGTGPDAVNALHDAQVRQVVSALFRELPPRQREVFHLADLEGLELAEIAERLVMNPVTVRVHLFKARRALRARLLERHPEIAEERAR